MPSEDQTPSMGLTEDPNGSASTDSRPHGTLTLVAIEECPDGTAYQLAGELLDGYDLVAELVRVNQVDVERLNRLSRTLRACLRVLCAIGRQSGDPSTLLTEQPRPAALQPEAGGVP